MNYIISQISHCRLRRGQLHLGVNKFNNNHLLKPRLYKQALARKNQLSNNITGKKETKIPRQILYCTLVVRGFP